MTDLIGRTVGPYQILSELGHGGMADVYRAVQPSIGREVAVKVLPAHFLQDRTFVKRFTREVQVIAKLQHPHILPVYDFGEFEGMPYIVMAYMPGGTLAQRIHQESGLPLEEIGGLVRQIASGLDYAHEKGIIHRDFKPSNVLLDEKGNVYLADFGIAKVTEETAQLTGSGIVGTPAYMAPEMTQEHSTTPLVDIYALGVTLFEMLAGQQPYRADTPMGTALAHVTRPIPDVRQYRADLPDKVQAVIERAMAKDPQQRYQSAGEMAAELQLALTPQPPRFAGSGRPLPEQPQSVVRGEMKSQTEPMSPTPPYAPTVDVVEPVALPRTEKMPTTPRRAPRRRGTLRWIWLGGAIGGAVVIVAGLAWRVLVTLDVFGGEASGGLPVSVAQTTAIPAVRPTNTPQPISVLTSTPRPASAPTNTPMPTGAPVNATDCRSAGLPEMACTGVERNDQWTPVIQESDGVEIVLVPAGCFMMGSTDGQIDYAVNTLGAQRSWMGNAKPTSQQCFEQPFWIGRMEVTNGQYGSSGNFSGDNHPRESIAWSDARAFCESRGARLPTEAEWEYAARGPDGLLYPWGNEFNSNNVVWNTSQTADMGSKPGGASWVGALDMSGNVWEWVSSWYGPYPYDATDGREGEWWVWGGVAEKGVRGGSWDNDVNYLFLAAYRSRAYGDNVSNVIGFRCARSY